MVESASIVHLKLFDYDVTLTGGAAILFYLVIVFLIFIIYALWTE